MTFRVELAAEAEQDATALLEWLISQNALETGSRWLASLQDAIDTLCQFPRRCALAPESKVFPFEVRQLLYGQKPHIYRILFTIDGSTVYVLHIRHGRREPLTV